MVGAYALVAMVLYLVASPLLTTRRAPRAMLAGIAILVAYGIVPAGMDLLVLLPREHHHWHSRRRG